ncbi:MAG: acyl carrier protein [Spirochaetales bacterium]|nr:acyl carrier protein [Spirochaetales bacterium]
MEKNLVEVHNTIRSGIDETLKEMGVDIIVSGADIDLREYIYDSLEYINFVLVLEEKLGIEVTNEAILYDNISSLQGYINLLGLLFEEQVD